MARSTRVSPPRSKKSSPSVNHRPPHQQTPLSPRRSSRLRSSPPRPNATRPTATSVPRAAATTEAKGPGHGHDSHHPSTEHRASVKEQGQEQELQLDPVPLPALSGKGALARRSATSLQPDAVAPRSPNKRRRGLDHYDLVPVPSSGSDVNNELTTPRTLRALKRQRLHLDPQQAPLPPKPSPSGPRHHRLRSPSPSFGEAQSVCPELPPEVPDNDLSAVGPDATAPATHEQNGAAFGDNDAAREQSGGGLPLSATDLLPSVPAPAVEESNAAASNGLVVVAEPSGAESPSIGTVTDLAAPSGPAAFVSADRSPSPAPASNDAVPPSLGAR
ncbi:hypothetical protein DAEQUDRAFT_494239 [Daedalea quercina L-15889]|uniref:Uncharacterized protein n=1 Tax=Daedalea quercina L-15889 TaxID=1314783 RepID=A0A165MN48_9APHY|nr:hypothetical protein DAEQUDRAFT_494239 [Daedalea quercina L-15889]